MANIAAIELLGDVHLWDVLQMARGADLLETHDRWSILRSSRTAATVPIKTGRVRAKVIFLAVRDDGNAVIAGGSLIEIANRISQDGVPRAYGDPTPDHLAAEVLRTAGKPMPASDAGRWRACASSENAEDADELE